MLRQILEGHLSNLVANNDVRNLDKALKLLVIFVYTLTMVQLQKFTYILESIISSDKALDSSEKFLLTLISSMLALAGYFLILEIADFLRTCASRIMSGTQDLFKHTFQIYSESEIEKQYGYNCDIVMTHDVKKYLAFNQDDRVKELYENHNRLVNHLVDRKRDTMTISILLALNFYINHEKINLISAYAQPYWVITIGLAIWSAFLPYESIIFMYIHNNKIRH